MAGHTYRAGLRNMGCRSGCIRLPPVGMALAHTTLSGVKAGTMSIIRERPVPSEHEQTRGLTLDVAVP